MLAAEARDLDELSGGRFVLGIGNGTRRMISDWHGLDGDAPATRMEELVPLLRRIWRLHEGPIDHEGRFYRLRIRALDAMTSEAPRDIPIYTAGVNPRMIESAGPRRRRPARPHALHARLHRGRRVAGDREGRAARRPRSCVTSAVTTLVMASAHADEEAARRECRQMIAFYGSVKSYGAIYAHEGFGDRGVSDAGRVPPRRHRRDGRCGERRDGRRVRRRGHAGTGRGGPATASAARPTRSSCSRRAFRSRRSASPRTSRCSPSTWRQVSRHR